MDKRSKAVQLAKLWRSILSILGKKSHRKPYNKPGRGIPLFWRELLASPALVGAALPSSPLLAKAIAKQVNPNQNGYVLELGGGTGSVTKALLKHGIKPERLIVIERSSAMVRYLRLRYPHVRVIQCNAEDTKHYLADIWQQIDHVVSGLPLCSLPDTAVNDIICMLLSLMECGTLYTHFTYKWRNHLMHKIEEIQRVQTKVVALNVPSAKVETFRSRCFQKAR